MGHSLITPKLAQSTYQIFNNAGLAAYFPFDANETLVDHNARISANFSVDTTIATGRILEALLFSTPSSSFFQSHPFQIFVEYLASHFLPE